MSDWTRSLLEPRRLGQLVLVAAAAGLLLFPVVSDDAYYENMIILSLVFAIGASGLNIIMGYAGYVSLGQGAFIGLGLLVAARNWIEQRKTATETAPPLAVGTSH